jgi:hypothetical protein
MNATLKKKLCWNCEGRVDLGEQNCPFCAVYLGPAPNDAGERKDDILAPPYKIVDSHENERPLAMPYSINESPIEEVQIAEMPTEITGGNDIRNVAIPITLLSGGLVFLLFGIILYLFSTNGVFTLQWNGSYWYLYLAMALPLLGFGWKLLLQFDKSKQ